MFGREIKLDIDSIRDSLFNHAKEIYELKTDNENLEKFACANDCNIMAAEYSIRRVKDFLMSQGFEKHTTTCRKFLQ